LIPLAITTISVLRIPPATDYDEPYSGADDTSRDIAAEKIRAVVDYPLGNLDLQGGQQNVSDYGLKCDPIPGGLVNTDWIKDDTSGRTFRIVWYLDFYTHIEARMRATEGEV
jgi:hypothetical protein